MHFSISAFTSLLHTLHLARIFESNFSNIPLKPLEERTFAKIEPPLGNRAKGYLAWHRSVLVCIAPVLLVTSCISIGHSIYSFRDSDTWFENYFGSTSWTYMSVASSSLMGVYRGSLAVEVTRYLSQIVGALLVIRALWHWSTLQVSANLLGMALLLATGMPFFLELTVPVASLIDLSGVQQAICVSELQSSISSLSSQMNGFYNLSSMLSDSSLEDVCTQVRHVPPKHRYP